ncbi:ribonuclease Z [Cellulomonas marina]|uniref:Ribonuclease Z n=1 Tax=Cellulomonas marina TaxID=988821 RepID=A0A1I1AJK5_9CELL|nr:ribonuclease Z [Cellulomonas marina]GIG30149.1 ribonuclease Z [Cellulomonas marina]SFB38211.1 ribonuclease Z [Cellulomonas marina]
MRELVVLGTASQVPTRTRNHNGYVLRWDSETYLFDPGEGTQRQLTLAGVAPPAITRICLTHLHGDHSLGLPGVLSRLVLDGVQHPVHLHYPRGGEDVLRALVGLATPGLDLRLHPHDEAGPVADGLEVAPLRHRVPTFGYRVVEPDGRTLLPDRLAAAGLAGPAVGELVRTGTATTAAGPLRLEDVSVPRPGQRVAVVMDTAPCVGAEALADGADLLLAECTFADEDVDLAAAYRHLTAGEAGALAGRAGARLLVLTHFSGRYDDLEPLAVQARAAAGDARVVVAHDLDRIGLPRRRGAAPRRR